MREKKNKWLNEEAGRNGCVQWCIRTPKRKKKRKKKKVWRTRRSHSTRLLEVRIRIIQRIRRTRRTRTHPIRSQKVASSPNIRRKSLFLRSNNGNSPEPWQARRTIDRSWRTRSRRMNQLFWCSLLVANCF